MRRLMVFARCLLLVLVAVAAGCTGGSNASPSAPSTPATSALIGVGNAAQTVVSGNGYRAVVSVPPTSDGVTGTLQIGVAAAPPSGVEAVDAAQRAQLAIGGTITPLVYISLTPSVTLHFASLPTLTFTLPPGTTPPPNGSAAYVALYDPGASATGWITVLGPGSVDGQTIAFAPLDESVTLRGGVTLTFALYVSADPTSITSTLAVFRATPKSFAIPALGSPTSNAVTVAITRVDGAPVNGGATVTGSPASCATGAFGYNTNGITTKTVTAVLWQNFYASAGCTFYYVFTDPATGNFIRVPIQAAVPPTFTVTPASVTPGFGAAFAATITASLSNKQLPNLSFTWNPGACVKYFAYTPQTPTAANAVPIQIFAIPQATYAASQPGADCPSAQLQVLDTTTNAMVPVAVATAPPPVLTVTPTTVSLPGVGSRYAASLTVGDSDALFSNGGIAFTSSSGASPSPSATACANAYTNSYTAPAGSVTAGTIAVYEVAPLAGTCVVTVKDAFSGQTAQVPVTLPTGSITIGGQ